MKRFVLFISALFIFANFAVTAMAVGEGNVDNGGGGMGSGTSTNMWIPGEEGVRVTVIRVSDGAQVSTSFDMASFDLRSTVYNFGIHSKLSYRDGLSLSVQAGDYSVVRPTLAMPKIISSASGAASIEEIKRYFCSEYAVQLVANVTGIDYDTLISGNYKILIEPIAYFLFNGQYFAMSAHQVALYDQILSGGLRAKMVSLSHKNLPLAMFLEHADLGYTAWTGSTTKAVSNDTIINYLGLGIVRFTEDEIITDYEFPGSYTPNYGSSGTAVTRYEYRTDIDVITAVQIDADREYNPDNPLTARFVIGGQNYIVKDIVIPEGESQLVWVKWRTPPNPQDISIRVTIGGRTKYILAAVEDLTDNEPPDPKADDRNDAFTVPNIPSEMQTQNLSWGVWSAAWHAYWIWVSDWVWEDTHWTDNGQWIDDGWYDFTYNRYEASLKVNQNILPDVWAATGFGSRMKSGYGFRANTETHIETDAPATAYTQAQTAVMYFPEFQYQTYFRVLDKDIQTYQSAFRFKENRYSTYKSRAHFTPIWYPDGEYKSYTQIYDAWTPAGMLRVNQSGMLEISGNLFEDWHIAPKK